MISHKRSMERRQFLKGTVGAASLVALSGCDNLTQSSWLPNILSKAEQLTEVVQRAVTPRDALAKSTAPLTSPRSFRQMGIPILVLRAMPSMSRSSFPDGLSRWLAWSRRRGAGPWGR